MKPVRFARGPTDEEAHAVAHMARSSLKRPIPPIASTPARESHSDPTELERDARIHIDVRGRGDGDVFEVMRAAAHKHAERRRGYARANGSS